MKEKAMEAFVMSIDVLQNKIRKLKNPAALVLAPAQAQIPEGMELEGYCCALLEALRERIGAVRVDPAAFLLLEGGPEALPGILKKAKALGYYILVDWTAIESPAQAKRSAQQILQGERWSCDGAVISGYPGTDTIKPWFKATANKKDLFVVVKTANKSGSEVQDLQTGGRFVYTAVADLASWTGENAVERCGYSRIGLVAGAYNAATLRTLREKYPKSFLIVDGVDEPGCNAKNVSYAFDKLGHGALVCASHSLFAAWQDAEEGTDPVTAAVEAAERMKRNIARYVTVL